MGSTLRPEGQCGHDNGAAANATVSVAVQKYNSAKNATAQRRNGATAQQSQCSSHSAAAVSGTASGIRRYLYGLVD